MKSSDRMELVKRLNHETGEYEYDWRYWLDGQEVTEAEYRGRYPAPKAVKGRKVARGQIRRGWPKRCLALAVHPDQVAEANERNRQHGISVHYEAGTGDAIIADRAARGKLLKIEGMHDRNSYTGN